MYMYYLLGYKINGTDRLEDISKRADNTFLLALDGDVDFLPDAVIKVTDMLGILL